MQGGRLRSQHEVAQIFNGATKGYT